MHLLYNGHIIREEDLQLPLSNRAFQYNDGFFETLMMRNGELQFLPDHVSRIQEAAAALRLELPASLVETETFEEALRSLVQINCVSDHARIKLKVWRAGGGLYTPQTNIAEWLATVQPATMAAMEPLHIGLCQGTRSMYSPLSHFKGPNALLYVLAGIEKKERDLDDLLLLSQDGYVSELISSNLFWIKDQVLYTAALQTGCVDGIVRRDILRWCQQQSIKLQEVTSKPETLQDADAVFASNVTGIRLIASIEGHELPISHPLIKQLQKELFG